MKGHAKIVDAEDLQRKIKDNQNSHSVAWVTTALGMLWRFKAKENRNGLHRDGVRSLPDGRAAGER